MSHNIGQIKYDDLIYPGEFFIPIDIDDPWGEYEDIYTPGDMTYYPQLVFPNLTLKEGVAYFVRIYFKRTIGYNQNVTINLRDTGNSILQKIKNVTINARTEDTESLDQDNINIPEIWLYYDFIFVPNRDGYTKISFDLVKNAYNANVNLIGKMVVLNQIVNLVATKIKAKHNVDRVVKLGIQTRPGTVVCINGEEVRLGKTGFYEINAGVAITYVGFGAELFDFIFDYVYNLGDRLSGSIGDDEDEEGGTSPGGGGSTEDLEIDDNIISERTTWSSAKIAAEIYKVPSWEKE